MKKAQCCSETPVEWNKADSCNGPEQDGWCIPLHGGGDVYYLDVNFCPLCGQRPREESCDPWEGDIIEDNVVLSNKECRNSYEGASCDCPKGRCWYSEQTERRASGKKALTGPAWDRTLEQSPDKVE